MKIKIKNKDGIILKTKNTIVTEDIEVLPDESLLGGCDNNESSDEIVPSNIPQINISSGTNNVNLVGNTYYILESPVAQEITFTLQQSTSSNLQEYMGEIQVGQDVVHIYFPENISWNRARNVRLEWLADSADVHNIIVEGSFYLEPNHTYYFSIINNKGLFGCIRNT